MSRMATDLLGVKVDRAPVKARIEQVVALIQQTAQIAGFKLRRRQPYAVVAFGLELPLGLHLRVDGIRPERAPTGSAFGPVRHVQALPVQRDVALDLVRLRLAEGRRVGADRADGHM